MPPRPPQLWVPATAGTPSAYVPSTIGNVGLEAYLLDHGQFQGVHSCTFNKFLLAW